MGRTVIDKTELKGEYNFKLEWEPEPGGGVEAPGFLRFRGLRHPPIPPAVDLRRSRNRLGFRLDAIRKGLV